MAEIINLYGDYTEGPLSMDEWIEQIEFCIKTSTEAEENMRCLISLLEVANICLRKRIEHLEKPWHRRLYEFFRG